MDSITQKEIEALKEAGMTVDAVVPVPYFSSGVKCGVPTEPGDATNEYVMIPADLFNRGLVSYVVRAEGDSMIDAGIFDGDDLNIQSASYARSGDIVLAWIDGKSTIKTYFEDDEGLCWLLPQNDKYQPILLKEEMNVKIGGIVVGITHVNPRIEYRSCARLVRDAKKTIGSSKPVTNYMIGKALKEVVDKITLNRQWYSIYRVLVDRDVVCEGDYNGFLSLLKDIMCEEAPTVTVDELKRMAVFSFAKPVALWEENNAPVHGTRFYDYMNIANDFNRALK